MIFRFILLDKSEIPEYNKSKNQTIISVIFDTRGDKNIQEKQNKDRRFVSEYKNAGR